MKKTIGYIILVYLRFFARLQLAKNKRAVIVGVTGTAGKSSTVDAISLILSNKGRVKKTSGSNSESGIPLNILGIVVGNYNYLFWFRIILLAPIQLLFNWEKFDYYIVEMGIDSPKSPKNMDYLLSIIKPDVGVMLGAGLTHAESFDHLVDDRNPQRRRSKLIRSIAKEKLKLVRAVGPTGTAVIVVDQKEVVSELGHPKARLITVGKSKSAKFSLSSPIISARGFRFAVSYQGQKYLVELPDFYEEGYLYTFACAIAVAGALGVTISKSIERLTSYRAPAGRLRHFRGINNTNIIDSSYNSSPLSLAHSLSLLSKVAVKAHKIAVIGDMRELGGSSKELHKDLATQLKESGSEVILFGKETQKYTLPLLLQSGVLVHHFTKMAELTTYLRSILKPKSWVLVKGSQNTILLERAVEAILADKEDIQYLCRRGTYWDRIRDKTA